MHDCTDLPFAEKAVDEGAVGDIAFEEGDVIRHHAATAGRQIVDYTNAPSRILEREDGMAADVAGTAGNEDWKAGHDAPSLDEAGADCQPRQACDRTEFVYSAANFSQHPSKAHGTYHFELIRRG